jgi:DoxX-like family
MIAKLTPLIPTILTAALAVIFLVAGAINISGRGTVRADFARWRFPGGFHLVCGGLELVGAALLLSPSTRFCGLALLGVIMAGAIFSLLRHREPISHLAPAFAIAALLALAAIAVSAGSFVATSS